MTPKDTNKRHRNPTTTMTNIDLDTEYGTLRCTVVEASGESIVIAYNDQYQGDAPFVRIHSSCLFSEAFHTRDCDCAEQLHSALDYIGKNGGYLIYLYQEGRGVGISEKLKAISLQHQNNINTAEAFSLLGHPPDCRSFSSAAEALRLLGINQVVLDTSNPIKLASLEAFGIRVLERIRLPIKSSDKIEKYVFEKQAALKHYENN